MSTMRTLSLFTSQILLWNYLFLLALKKKPTNLLNYSSQSTSPAKTKLGGKRGVFTRFNLHMKKDSTI